MSERSEYVGIALDAQAIKVLAHPLRSRLLSRLRTAGPATATDLAAALTTNTGATSYHLRKLESVGLVTDTGEGEGKRRLWRASTDFHSWTNSAFRDDEDAATALDWLQRDYVRQLAEKAERWLDAAPNWPAEWVDVLRAERHLRHGHPGADARRCNSGWTHCWPSTAPSARATRAPAGSRSTSTPDPMRPGPRPRVTTRRGR